MNIIDPIKRVFRTHSSRTLSAGFALMLLGATASFALAAGWAR